MPVKSLLGIVRALALSVAWATVGLVGATGRIDVTLELSPWP